MRLRPCLPFGGPSTQISRAVTRFWEGEGGRFRVPLAEPFLCSAEAAVHMFYIPSSGSLHGSITFGFYYYSTLEIPQLK